MITRENFLTQSIDYNSLTDLSRKAYDFVKENHDLYELDDDIKKAIDLSIAQLNETAGKMSSAPKKKDKAQFVAKSRGKKPSPKPAPKPAPVKAKAEKKAKAKKDAVAKPKKQPAKFKAGQTVYYKHDGEQTTVKEVSAFPDGSPMYRLSNGDVHVEDHLTTTKPAAKKTPAANKPLPDLMLNKHTTEVKFIKRYVNMLGKNKTYKQVLDLLLGLQRAINDKQIGKTSPLAKEIKGIQDVLIEEVNKKKETIKLLTDEATLSRLVSIAGGEGIYKSIALLKSYIGMQGKKPLVEKVRSLLTRAKKADLSSDPYEPRVKQMIKNLQAFLDKKTTTVELEKVDLSGLQGLLGVSSQKKSPNLSGLSGVMSSAQLAATDFDTYELTGEFYKLIGNPQTNFSLMLWGEPGQGKSTISMKFARYLANRFGKVAYLSSEEFGSMTLKDKLMRVGGMVPGWDFTRDLKAVDLSKYQFLFVDSVNNLGMEIEQLRELKAKYKHLSIVLIMQATKDGKYKGTKEWEHEVETVVHVANGEATTTKNRFAGLTSIQIF